MDVSERNSQQSDVDQDEEMGMDQEELRRGPWTVEEDLTLINYIALHGEGRWNSLARSAGLKRTGKSCRLRWLNYLRPDVRRGNITLEEQLLILELHSRWGNRWSKIAQYLPGRTDNEIKNYWRTRVQKHAKQLKCDVNSKQFKDTMRYLWMPRLVERIQAASAVSCPIAAASMPTMTSPGGSTITNMTGGGISHRLDNNNPESIGTGHGQVILDNSSMSTTSSSDSLGAHQQVSPMSELTDYYPVLVNENPDHDYLYSGQGGGCGTASGAGYKLDQTMAGARDGYYNNSYALLGDYQLMDQDNNYQYFDGGDTSGNLWNVEDIWYTNQNV